MTEQVLNLPVMISARNIRKPQIKFIAAGIFSVLYTSFIAYIIYGSLNYPVNHLVFDLVYAFVYFLVLNKGYKVIMKWLERRFGHLEEIHEKYFIGLIVFILFALLAFTLIAIVPFFLILGNTVGAIESSMEIRMNYSINVLVATVYYFFVTSFQVLKSYHDAQIQSEKLQKDIAQAQFEALKHQVNPHFLFNSLNVLSSLVHQDADLSEKFIDQLAKAYRYVLEQKDQELVLLKTELDFINSFVFLLKIRFEEKLQVNIRVQAEKLTSYLPPLTLQLLLENAVKHNSLSFESPLIVNIYTDNEGSLVVENNVQLRQQETVSTGVGLKNITSRYKYLSTNQPAFYQVGNKYISKIPLIQK